MDDWKGFRYTYLYKKRRSSETKSLKFQKYEINSARAAQKLIKSKLKVITEF